MVLEPPLELVNGGIDSVFSKRKYLLFLPPLLEMPLEFAVSVGTSNPLLDQHI
jgi:hypothetical protein